jgi:molecular chaperone GrpE (heat shock protein)
MSPEGMRDTKEPLSEYLAIGEALAGAESRSREREREILRFFIEVMDSFDRFLAVAGPDSSLPHLRTVRLIAKQHLQALRQTGAIPMECEGKVAEPGLHEIADSRICEDVEDGIVLEVISRGYADPHGEPLRKARVIVSHREPSAV